MKNTNRFELTLWGVGLSIGLAAACASNNDASDDGNDDGSAGSAGSDGSGGGGNEGAVSTFNEVASVATMIYDAVEAGEDVTPHIEAVLGAFGVPVLENDDTASALAQIEAGLPFVTTRVVTHMAEAYASGRLNDTKGFAEGLVEQGVGLGYPYNLGGDPLDSTFLGSMIYTYSTIGEVEPDVPMEAGYVLPTLVRALGQERARRSSADDVDPIWGDERLDPLQFTLLSFTIFAKPAAPPLRIQSTKIRSAAGFIKGLITDKLKDTGEGVLVSGVQDFVEVPLDKGDAAKVSVCGSLILYGHKVAMTNTPKLLWRAPKTPNLTQVDLTLTFEDDYHDNWARAVLGGAVTDLTGCTFPRQGPIEGKSITWSVSSGLEGQGSYDLMQSTTDEFGQAVASWRTISEELPPACQVFEKQRDAVGATQAVVSGLLPGWSTVETIVNFLNPNTGGQGDAALTVLYYDVAYDDPCHSE